MTAETDIAAIADGAANTAAEVRTALTSVLGRADTPGILVKSTPDDPPDDEFDDATGMSGAVNGLDAKWTAVSGASGTAAFVQTADVSVYDLTSRPGWLLMQAGSDGTEEVSIRQDYTLPDNASIVVAYAHAFRPRQNTAWVGNEYWFGLSLNNNDTAYDAGTWAGLFFDAQAVTDPVEESRLVLYDGTNVAGESGPYAGGRMSYLRMTRSSLTYYAHFSFDGTSWVPLGSFTVAGAHSNVWVFADNKAVGGDPVPVQAVQWVRLGGSGIDPW